MTIPIVILLCAGTSPFDAPAPHPVDCDALAIQAATEVLEADQAGGNWLAVWCEWMPRLERAGCVDGTGRMVAERCREELGD